MRHALGDALDDIDAALELPRRTRPRTHTTSSTDFPARHPDDIDDVPQSFLARLPDGRIVALPIAVSQPIPPRIHHVPHPPQPHGTSHFLPAMPLQRVPPPQQLPLHYQAPMVIPQQQQQPMRTAPQPALDSRAAAAELTRRAPLHRLAPSSGNVALRQW